jgi:hypothetical protein
MAWCTSASLEAENNEEKTLHCGRESGESHGKQDIAGDGGACDKSAGGGEQLERPLLLHYEVASEAITFLLTLSPVH